MIHSDKKNYLSIDIGGTNIKYGMLDNSGNLLFHKKIMTPHSENDLIISLKNIVKPYLTNIRGIGISVPGKVDTKTGTIYYGGSLPFLDKISLKDKLEEVFKIPVAVGNDGKSGALAELWLGSLKKVDNGAIIILGTGVGGGIILNHQLVQGSHYQAGELSYMNLNQGMLNKLNLVGYSGSAVKMVEECAKALEMDDLHDGIRVFDEINKKNSKVMKIFTNYCNVIAEVILNIQSVIDLNTFAISGGISSQKVVIDGINKSYARLLDSNPLLKEQMVFPNIVQAHFKNDANLYGALYNWFLQNDKSIFRTA